MALTAFSVVCSAQGFNQKGHTTEDLFPKGWKYDAYYGDLNQDGSKDVVIMALPENRKWTEVTEYGDTIKYSQPLLAIYFGRNDDYYHLWETYEETLPVSDNYTEHDISIEITDRGVLRINITTFHHAGGWGNGDDSFVFRFQDGDFFMIGMDQHVVARNTGREEIISENYITHKRQQIIDNVFDEDFKRVEKWTRIPDKPLRSLRETLL